MMTNLKAVFLSLVILAFAYGTTALPGGSPIPRSALPHFTNGTNGQPLPLAARKAATGTAAPRMVVRAQTGTAAPRMVVRAQTGTAPLRLAIRETQTVATSAAAAPNPTATLQHRQPGISTIDGTPIVAPIPVPRESHISIDALTQRAVSQITAGQVSTSAAAVSQATAGQVSVASSAAAVSPATAGQISVASSAAAATQATAGQVSTAK